MATTTTRKNTITQAQFEKALLVALNDEGYARTPDDNGGAPVALRKGDVEVLLEVVGETIAESLGKRGESAVSVRGLGRYRTRKTKATKARKGINPFTGEEATFKAKPAGRSLRVRAARSLRDLVA